MHHRYTEIIEGGVGRDKAEWGESREEQRRLGVQWAPELDLGLCEESMPGSTERAGSLENPQH